MDSREFAQEIEARVVTFCQSLDVHPPAYSYVPLSSDAMRIKVMKSRLFNEIRAGEIFGSGSRPRLSWRSRRRWPKPYTRSFRHAEFLAAALRKKGAEPYDYQPVPAQMGMFNAFEALMGTVERMAAFPLAGEGVADYLIRLSLKAATVPEWVLAPYRQIHEDEETHGNYPAEVLMKYAMTEDTQERVRCAVEMSLLLRRQYFDNLDRWVFEGKAW